MVFTRLKKGVLLEGPFHASILCGVEQGMQKVLWDELLFRNLVSPAGEDTGWWHAVLSDTGEVIDGHDAWDRVEAALDAARLLRCQELLERPLREGVDYHWSEDQALGTLVQT